MMTTKLNLNDKLPLTCSRTGTCCHGKIVRLNPWELVWFAEAKNISSREFRDLYCDFGGIILKFDGNTGWKNMPACSQYAENSGCSVHAGRPLSCRLYPLGRQIQNEKIQYIYRGEEFPCFEGCPEVKDLPYMTVGEYLEGQGIGTFEKAQDAYLELMQNIADIAFMLLLDTGLAESGDKKTLQLWRKMGCSLPVELADRLGSDWVDSLMLPEIHDHFDDPASFAEKHLELLQEKAQNRFESLQTLAEFSEASVLMITVALYLAHGLGADASGLAGHWIDTAKGHGAQERG